MISYTHDQTTDFNQRLMYPSDDKRPPSEKDLQSWATGMAQYAQKLTKVDPTRESIATTLLYDSQEIVYLFDYAAGHEAWHGENPPPLWMKRYNDVAAGLELWIHALDSDCPGGAPRPAHPRPTSTTSTTTAPPPPQITYSPDITDKLLKPDELASIVGDADMKEVRNYTQLAIRAGGVDPPDCAARVRVGNTFPYYSGRAEMAGKVNLGARGQKVSQLITVWQDREQPKKVVSQSAYEWEHYCDQPFTEPSDNSDTPMQWVPDRNLVERDSPANPTSIVTWDYHEELPAQKLPAQICYHRMASRANVLVEDIVCGDGDASQIANFAKEIADRMLSNFPQ